MLQNNESSWLEIWERKGREAAGKPEYGIADLLSADGFDGAMAQTGPLAQRHIASFIAQSLGVAAGTPDAFASPEDCRRAVEALPPSPDLPIFFEYNFLFVLAAGGRAEKAALGDHSPAGYAQRARFYAISPGARLLYAKGVAGYLIFLAEHTGLACAERCAGARSLLAAVQTYGDFLGGISR